MRFSRKFTGEEWETFEVSKDEVKKIRKRTVKEIKDVIALIKKEFPGLENETFTVILDKLAPSYGSLLDDFVSSQLKKLLKEKDSPE